MAAAQPTSTPATRSSHIDQADVEDWKKRFNDVLSRAGDVVKSKSPATSQPWHAGFFDCFNPIDTCLITYCLPCITFGKTHHRMRKDSTLKGYEPINTSCLLFCGAGCFGVHWIPLAMQRMEIREKYNLEGSCLKDLALSFCCHCCSMIQDDKEAEHREQLLRSSGVQQQYQANTEKMAVPPATTDAAPAAPAAPVVAPALAEPQVPVTKTDEKPSPPKAEETQPPPKAD